MTANITKARNLMTGELYEVGKTARDYFSTADKIVAAIRHDFAGTTVEFAGGTGMVFFDCPVVILAPQIQAEPEAPVPAQGGSNEPPAHRRIPKRAK